MSSIEGMGVASEHMAEWRAAIEEQIAAEERAPAAGAEAEADAEAAAVALVRGRLAAAAPLTRATSSQLFLGVCIRSELRSD